MVGVGALLQQQVHDLQGQVFVGDFDSVEDGSVEVLVAQVYDLLGVVGGQQLLHL